MKNIIKTSMLAVVVLGSSFAQAGQNRHEQSEFRVYNKPHSERHYRQNERRQDWKHQQRKKHKSGYQRHYKKQHYAKYRDSYRSHWKHNRRHVEKRVFRDNRGHRVEKHIYHSKRYYAPRTVVKKVIIRDRHYHNNALPVIAGGLIGSSIANNVSEGDPIATFGGAVFGAMIGNAISHR